MLSPKVDSVKTQQASCAFQTLILVVVLRQSHYVPEAGLQLLDAGILDLCYLVWLQD